MKPSTANFLWACLLIVPMLIIGGIVVYNVTKKNNA